MSSGALADHAEVAIESDAASGEEGLQATSLPGEDPLQRPDVHPYPQMLGERLRRVRQQQGVSLLEVEHRSAGEFKASVLGAYERGERALSVPRLHRLAAFYRVPVAELLPDPRVERAALAARDADEVVIDLVALEEQRATQPVLYRYVIAIQARRGDYNGRVLTVRRSDLDTLAAVLDDGSSSVLETLTAAGIVR